MILDLTELRKIREQTEKGAKSDAIVLTKQELDRMKQAAIVRTKEEDMQQRKIHEEQKDQQLAAAKAM